MLPPLKTIKAGLHRTTEALAAELAQPGSVTPAWNELEWRLATVAAVVHGVSPLLSGLCEWKEPEWQRFLANQREHVALRHQRIARLLEHIDVTAKRAGLALTPLKGSALHAIGLYTPGERPMADVDLLVCESDADRAAQLLKDIGYVESFSLWRHRVFKSPIGQPYAGLGEHRDTPIVIELHVHIQERLPVSVVDITDQIHPQAPHSGLNDYPSTGALMSHLLLHAAGNICNRGLRLLHLHDIAILAARMSPGDWDACFDERRIGSPWWALPPLLLVARYYKGAIPADVLARITPSCPIHLRTISRHQTLTQVSCSEFLLHAFPGVEWSRSAPEASRYVRNRLKPSKELIQQRKDMARTQLWLQGDRWATSPQRRRVLTWLTRPVPRLDALFAVRAALEQSAP
jgi:hypothetical protein